MHIPLDIQSDVPLYSQIENYLRDNILSGALEAETRLPATRKLAHDLGVNRITIENAYAGLEADGLIYSHVGKGTYILPVCQTLPLAKNGGIDYPQWQHEAMAKCLVPAKFYPDIKLDASNYPHPISFSSGTGDPLRFPVNEFRKIMNMILNRDGIEALKYGNHHGYYPLRETIAHLLANQGVKAHPDNLLITAGSQQALALISQFLLSPGDYILTESPTYAGALYLFRANGFQITGIPCDDNGMQVDKLEKKLRQFPIKLIYTIPNFQNPTGTCMSSTRRRQLVSLAIQYNIPILEDDFVGDLRYDGRIQPTLKSLDAGGGVIYISTFSKMLMPGLRIGFMLAEGPVLEGLSRYKAANDISSSNLIQRALEAYVTVGRYQAHYRRSCQIYRQRRDSMQWAVNRYLPASIETTSPKGGLFMWLRFLDNLSTEKLLPLACEEGVSFDPGKYFFPDGEENENCLRLNFTTHPPKVIEEGIKRLGKAIKRLSQQT